MKAERLTKSSALPAAAIALTVAWILMNSNPGFEGFGISQYLLGAASVAANLAITIVNYLSTWWGFAAAVAAAAAFGMSWTVVLIKAVLQKVGIRFAIEYATML
jgi:hypothetical protein